MPSEMRREIEWCPDNFERKKMQQAQALSSSKEKLEAGWDTVWVNDNGTQILLDEETDIPDDINISDLEEPKVSFHAQRGNPLLFPFFSASQRRFKVKVTILQIALHLCSKEPALKLCTNSNPALLRRASYAMILIPQIAVYLTVSKDCTCRKRPQRSCQQR